MSDRRITDEGVTGLSIHEGRAELLEEIMAIPTDHEVRTVGTDDIAPRRTRRWVPALAAAAAVAAIAGLAAAPRLLPDDEPRTAEAPYAGQPGSADGELAVLEADGWLVEYDDSTPQGGLVSYLNGDQRLEIDWRPAGAYAGYVEDRDDVSARTPVDVLGEPAIMWTYADDDHAVIRPAVDDFFLEIRGSGMDEAAFAALLGQVRLVDEAGLQEHVAAAPRVSPQDLLYNEPPKPMLIDAAGWVPLVDEEGEVSWDGPDGASILVTWVSGVADPFTYDRYRGADLREEVRLLGTRALHASWEESGRRYDVAATMPVADGDTILVLEGTGMTHEQFLGVVGAARWVPIAEYEQVVRAAIG